MKREKEEREGEQAKFEGSGSFLFGLLKLACARLTVESLR
jgi:hypothetical protein